MDVPQEVVDAKAAVELGLIALPGVVGVALGMREVDGDLFDELAVRVFVEDGNAVPDGLPADIAGVPVCVIERRFEPCALPDTFRYPNLPGGIQITSPLRGTGTLGVVVEDTATGETLGLTCFHVVGGPGQPFPGNVWQPTSPPLVVGVPPADTDNVGDVLRVDFPQTPPLPGSPVLVGMTDSAVVGLDRARANGRGPSRAIMAAGFGQPPLVDAVTATATVSPGTGRVGKRGFQTGVTHGLVISRFFTVRWTPGGPNTWLMDQVEINGDTDAFVQPGDSGSLVLDDSSRSAVGLLWGQNATGLIPAGKIGVMSEIAAVETALGVSTVFA